jgi:isoamylase
VGVEHDRFAGFGRLEDGPLPGTPFPLGATLGERAGVAGVNFALASSVADGVTLCLFDPAGAEAQVRVVDNDADVWHVFVPGVGAGQAYGYRIAGPWEPARGLRCNPAKLLLDPYAKAISGAVTFGPEVLGQDQADPARPSGLDSAAHVPRSVVVDTGFGWRDARRPWYSYATRAFPPTSAAPTPAWPTRPPSPT